MIDNPESNAPTGESRAPFPNRPFNIPGWDRLPGPFKPGDCVRLLSWTDNRHGVVIGPDPEGIFDYAVIVDGYGTSNRHFYDAADLEFVPWRRISA